MFPSVREGSITLKKIGLITWIFCSIGTKTNKFVL